MVTAILVTGLVLALALLASLHRRLEELPRRVWSLARNEREANETRALDTMKEAVAARVGPAVLAIKRYEEQMGDRFRVEAREAIAQRKAIELRAADTLTALEAASALVRELRAAADGVARSARVLGEAVGGPLPKSLTVAPGSDDEEAERRTVEITPDASGHAAVDGGDEGDGGEETTVAAIAAGIRSAKGK